MRALAVLLGPVVWFAHLGFVYSVHALVCATGGQPAWLMGGATAAALLAITVAVGWPRALAGGGATPFLLWVMRTLAGLSFLAVLFHAVAMALLPVCQQLR
jgi:hypothetical protein